MASLAAGNLDHELLNLQNGLFDSGTKLDTLAPVAPVAGTAPNAAPQKPSRAWHMAGLMAVAATVGALIGAGAWKLVAKERAGEQVAAAVAPTSMTATPSPRAVEAAPASRTAPAAPAAALAPAAKEPPAVTPAVASPGRVAKAVEPPAVGALKPAEPSPVVNPEGARVALPAGAGATGAVVPELPAVPSPAARSIDNAAATRAIAAAARSSGSCLDADSGTVSMPVRVTFAPSGRVTTAMIGGGSLIGTPAGSCVARSLRTATVAAFDGTPVTISTLIRVR